MMRRARERVVREKATAVEEGGMRRLATKMELVSDLEAHNRHRIIPPTVLPATCHACRSKH